MTQTLPRIASVAIERKQIDAWLVRNAHMPLRVLLAPPGSGKTTVLVRYAKSCEHELRYIHITRHGIEAALSTQLAAAFGLAAFDQDAIFALMHGSDRFELIIDGIERIGAGEAAMLERFVEEMPAHVGLIYAGTAVPFSLHRLEATGLAEVLPKEDFAFGLDETAQLAAAYGLPMRPDHLSVLHERCEGWAVVLGDIFRSTSERETSLVDGYDRWLVQRGRSFTGFLQEEVGHLTDTQRASFEALLRGERLGPDDCRRLESSGAFVVAEDGGLRPYRVASDLLVERKLTPAAEAAHISVRMFGRFSIRNGDREVSWIRRRDQQIFRYIAVRPNGCVKKAEIIAVFWPEADPHLAAQSLRTACSNIRKAIAAAIDTYAVDRIFITEGQELRVNLERFAVDVHRFKAHILAGNEADDESRLSDALAHYRAAEVLYRADLFGGEPEEAWFIPQREIYRDMATFVRDRIIALRMEIGDGVSASPI